MKLSESYVVNDEHFWESVDLIGLQSEQGDLQRLG